MWNFALRINSSCVTATYLFSLRMRRGQEPGNKEELVSRQGTASVAVEEAADPSTLWLHTGFPRPVTIL